MLGGQKPEHRGTFLDGLGGSQLVAAGPGDSAEGIAGRGRPGRLGFVLGCCSGPALDLGLARVRPGRDLTQIKTQTRRGDSFL